MATSGSCSIVESNWGKRSIVFAVSVSGSSIKWTLTVKGELDIWYSTKLVAQIAGTTVKSYDWTNYTTRQFPTGKYKDSSGNYVTSVSGSYSYSGSGRFTCSLTGAIYNSSIPLSASFELEAGGSTPVTDEFTFSATGGTVGETGTLAISGPSARQRYTVTVQCGNSAVITLGTDYVPGSYSYVIPSGLQVGMGARGTAGIAYFQCHETTTSAIKKTLTAIDTIYASESSMSGGTVSVVLYDPPNYSSSTIYNKGDLTKHNSVVYQCLVDGTTGTWNNSKWIIFPLADVPLANRAQMVMSWSGAHASDGATIQHIIANYGSHSEIIPNQVGANGTYLIHYVPNSGEVEFSITVVDSRGFKYTTEEPAVYTMIQYDAPRITSMYAYRCKFKRTMPTEYDSTVTYNANDIVTHEYKDYYCLQNGTTGTWNPARWKEFGMFNSINTYNNGDVATYKAVNYVCNHNGTTGAWNPARWNISQTLNSYSRDDEGTEIEVTFTWEYTDLDGQNQIESSNLAKRSAVELNFITIQENLDPSVVYHFGTTGDPYSIDHSYQIRLMITDTLLSTATKIVVVGSESAIMDFYKDGTGMAIGKVSEEGHLLDIGLPTQIMTPTSSERVDERGIWIGDPFGQEQGNGLLIDTSGSNIDIYKVYNGKKIRIPAVFVQSSEPSSSEYALKVGDLWIET